MSAAALVRASGFALALAGLLLAVAILFHPSDADPHAVVRPAWVPVHTVLTLATLLLLFGLMGLYLGRLRDTSGWLGLVGFVSLFTGTALFVAALSIEAFVLPALATSTAGPVLLASTGPLFGGPLGAVLLLTGSLFALGCLLWCVSIVRGALTPRWAGLPLLGGILLAFWPPLPQWVGTIGAVVLGLGLIWLGYLLVAPPGHSGRLAGFRGLRGPWPSAPAAR
jgi:hypothetical protein